MKKLIKRDLIFGLMLSSLTLTTAFASDHDDGEADLKGRSLNLTDVYAFREDKEITSGSAAHVVFIVNSNPRSLPQQQYYFSTQARYELHIARVGTGVTTDKDLPAKTAQDITLRVEFAEPDAAGKQAMTITSIVGGASTTFTANNAGSPILTTPLSAGATPDVSAITAGGQEIKVFAGLRKDPFFFDVNAFFRFRLAAAASTPGVPPGFSGLGAGGGHYTPNLETPQDFTQNYNANTIAFRVPIAFLANAGQKIFDTWASVSIPQ
ncbi:MAG TPA: DUF4331 family protein [Bacteriovoracaceae bacterium]|nr:DUF4331 family protein [Bacteriovoracaceae bacterium]